MDRFIRYELHHERKIWQCDVASVILKVRGSGRAWLDDERTGRARLIGDMQTIDMRLGRRSIAVTRARAKGSTGQLDAALAAKANRWTVLSSTSFSECERKYQVKYVCPSTSVR